MSIPQPYLIFGDNVKGMVACPWSDIFEKDWLQIIQIELNTEEQSEVMKNSRKDKDKGRLMNIAGESIFDHNKIHGTGTPYYFKHHTKISQDNPKYK